MSLHRLLLGLCYLTGLVVLAYLVSRSYPYYMLPVIERPHYPLHVGYKPGGRVGHGLGVTGGSMILLLFIYSARKRGIIRWGSLPHWLDFHIMLGLLGPLLVTLHTAFKFGGIVAVCYFSMMAVMASGIFGRYLYVQIPRTLTGGELTAREMNARRDEIRAILVDECGLSDAEIADFQGRLAGEESSGRTGLSILLTLLAGDLLRPVRYRSLGRALRHSRPGLAPEVRDKALRRLEELALLTRKTRFLETTRRIFHLWHVIHRPFAYVMVLILMIHVTVVISYGYRWIF